MQPLPLCHFHGLNMPNDRAGRALPETILVEAVPRCDDLFLRAAGYNDAQIERIMFGNAVRFFGLGSDEYDRLAERSTRRRLEKFYAAHNLSADWMTAFD